MSEVIMRYSGSGEDLHNLKWVGELVRYNCPFYEREEDTNVNVKSW